MKYFNFLRRRRAELKTKLSTGQVIELEQLMPEQYRLTILRTDPDRASLISSDKVKGVLNLAGGTVMREITVDKLTVSSERAILTITTKKLAKFLNKEHLLTASFHGDRDRVKSTVDQIAIYARKDYNK